MVHFNISMQHTEKTFEKLAHMQYDLFCKGNLVSRTVLGAGAVIFGIMRFEEWWGVLLIAYGSYILTGKYNSANHTAHKLTKQIMASGMPFPASRYVFRDKDFEVIPLPENTNGEPIAYSDVHRIGEDLEYFYLFRNQYGGYMLPKSELGERTKAFREFIEEKTGQKFRDREVPIVKIMRKLKLIH